MRGDSPRLIHQWERPIHPSHRFTRNEGVSGSNPLVGSHFPAAMPFLRLGRSQQCPQVSTKWHASGMQVAGENTTSGGHHPPALLHCWPDHRMGCGNQSCTALFARLFRCTTAAPWRLGPARRDHGEFTRPVVSAVDIPARREGGVRVPKPPREGYGIHARIGSEVGGVGVSHGMETDTRQACRSLLGPGVTVEQPHTFGHQQRTTRRSTQPS